MFYAHIVHETDKYGVLFPLLDGSFCRLVAVISLIRYKDAYSTTVAGMQLLTADTVNKRELEITKTEKTKRTKTC